MSCDHICLLQFFFFFPSCSNCAAYMFMNVCGLPLGCVWPTSGTSKGNGLLVSIRCQQHLFLGWLELSWSVCILSVVHYYVKLPPYVQRTVFFIVFFQLQLLQSFCLSFRNDHWAVGREDEVEMFPIGMNVQQSLILCTLAKCTSRC